MRLYIDKRVESILSPFVHYSLYKVRKPRIRLEKSMLITSVDIDVGKEVLGVLNRGKYDVNVRGKSKISYSERSIGKIEEQALPLIMSFFNKQEIRATFAVRGQLLEVDDSILDSLDGSSVKHEIAAHGYYHSDFTRLTHKGADLELKVISDKLKSYNIVPRSFIFPKNKVAHLGLLERHGYKCYRGNGSVISDAMDIKKEGQLYDVRPSLFVGNCTNVRLTRNMINIAVQKRLPFHIWLHSWNLGLDRKSIAARIERFLSPLYTYAKSKEKSGVLTIETMISAIEKISVIS